MDEYRIGTIAGLLGISAEALRLYEREGVLDIRREEGDGRYRIYDHTDVGALMRARTYRGCGFSLQEAGRLLKEESTGAVAETLRRREEALQKELRFKQRTLETLRELRLAAESLPQALGVIRRTVSPPMLRFEYMHNDEVTLLRAARRDFRVWSGSMPLTFPSQRYHREEDGRTDVFIALAAHPADAEWLELPVGAPEVRRSNALPCLYTAIRVAGPPAGAAAQLEPLWEYARRNGFRPCGDAVGRTLLSHTQEGKHVRYREVWLPVE